MADERTAKLGELERAVMEQLWAAEAPLTVRAVHESLTPSRAIAYTTVMTVLDRLARKSMVLQERAGRAFTYAPARRREDITADLMREALDTVDDGDRAAALVRFVDGVSETDVDALRDALARLGQRLDAGSPP